MEPAILAIEVDGIPMSIDRNTFDDFRILGLAADYQDGDLTVLYKLAVAILGEEQLENVLKSVEETRGHASIAYMGEFLGKLMQKAAEAVRGEAKN